WRLVLTVRELAGYPTTLTGLRAQDFYIDDRTSEIQQIFGTTRLAPYGTLKGVMCFLTGVNETPVIQVTGTAGSSSVSATLGARLGHISSVSPSVPSLVPPSLALKAADSLQTLDGRLTAHFAG